MKTFLFSLLLIGTVSFPPFVFPQYTQPLPVFIIVFIIIRACRLNSSSRSYAFLVIGSTILLLLISVIVYQRFDALFSLSYCVCAVLLLAGFVLASNLRTLASSLSRSIIIATCLIPFIVFTSIIVDYIFPGFLDYIKFNPSLSGGFLFLRSKSGLLPEPSFVGSTCSLSYLFLCCQLYILKDNHLASIDSTLIKRFSLNFTLLSVAISLSVSSVASCLGFLFTAFAISGDIDQILSQALAFVKRARIGKSNIATLILLALVIIASFAFFASRDGSRIHQLYTRILEGSFTWSQDESTIDRSLSTIFGLETPFVNLFGFGINGFTSALEYCDRFSLVTFFAIDCSRSMSYRNHNLIANYIQDFGLIGVFYLLLNLRLLGSSFSRFDIYIIMLIVWACITPNSLVSILFCFVLASMIIISTSAGKSGGIRAC